MNLEKKRERDAKWFEELDGDLCMVCLAHGQDKKSLFVSCSYQVDEIVPEFICLDEVDKLSDRGYYMRICKECRARFLDHLRAWWNEGVLKRGKFMDRRNDEHR